MRSYDRLMMVVFFCTIFCFIGGNLYLSSGISENKSREYRVEAERVADDIKKFGWKQVDLSQYPAILGIELLKEDREGFFQGEEDYIIREIDGNLYRIDYSTEGSLKGKERQLLWGVNLMMGLITALVFGVLFFVRYRILKPFEQLSEVPYSLARGNLTIPLQEDRNRFFGKFIWGLNLLRENLEQGKQQELKLQKEKKMLVLSISHDIKTPLSAIKLYAKALSRGLYPEKERQREIAESIDGKADDIENFVSEIIRASHEDFLSLPVKQEEYLLSAVLQEIEEYYREKLQLIRTEFVMEGYRDCLLRGDRDRLVEVLQNIMENAVKYGDGRQISITVSWEEDCCLMGVRNSGCTITQTELTYIFDSFWRGTNAEHVKGSGLGLYICRKLMEKMDGSIYAEIEGEEMCVMVVVRKA